MGGDKDEARALAEKITVLNPSEGYLAHAELAELEKNLGPDGSAILFESGAGKSQELRCAYRAGEVLQSISPRQI